MQKLMHFYNGYIHVSYCVLPVEQSNFINEQVIRGTPFQSQIG